jgi:hypothetical protein
MRQVAAALVHHPVLDRQGEIVTTAITNLDLHDISRSAHTYGLTHLFITHPVLAQRELALRVRSHWTDGSGARRIPDRKPALERVTVVQSLDEAKQALGECEVWVTSASTGPDVLGYAAARDRIVSVGAPVLLVFGTGWGLAREVMDSATLRLAPLESPRADGYNHLSVRAAAAIIFDRLLGPRSAG